MSIYKKYFDENFDNIVKNETKKISHLLDYDMFIICGDFYGIQKFIFERLSAKNASKVLRAKSAFIQVFTKYIAKYICHKLGIDEDYILISNAGKFEIISPIRDEAILQNIQKKINNYFIANFYGLSGMNICSVTCSKDDFNDKKRYKALRTKIANEVEMQKFSKFSLISRDEFVLNYDNNIDNHNLCSICNIRKKITDNCKICDEFIKLGRILTLKEQTNYKVDYLKDFSTTILIDKKLKSYILKDGKNPATFETLAKNSCSELESGVRSLAILKADVDSMGNFLQNSDVTDSFENFDTFSKTLDNFFSLYVPKLMRENYKNTYTVFAGGDDLFLVGSWDEVLKLAREIHKDFEKFIKGKLSISFGISLAKPSTPISYLANHTEELLESAKEIDEDKNAISLFGETVKWDSYLKVYDKLQNSFREFEKVVNNTSFLYRLLELCDMSKNIQKNIKNTMWKSKLNYTFMRNVGKEHLELLKVLDEMIEKNPKESKMFLNEFIYKRREV
ncbi:hypothetical protein MLC52_09855 [Sulfurimonas sp. NW15]|uniref:type III-A CRISPR-associated protein Cas10/Csm1 n=1 Tax=Sulfurimonas sp. NW15 TaxID=2922729 RepID=UPI003DA9EA71